MNRTRPAPRPGAAILLAALLLAPATGWGQQAAPAVDAAQVEALESAVRTLTAETGSLNEQLRALEQSLAERDQGLAAAEAEIGARDVRVKGLATELEAARAAAAAPAAQVAALETDLATARAEAAEKAAALAALTARADAAAAGVADLEARVRNAEAAAQDANARLAERDGQIQAMRAELLAARNDLSSAETQLDGKSRENAALAAAARELVAGGDALAGQLATLEGDAAELQEELATTQAAARDGETRSRELEVELDRLTGPDTVFFTQLREALGQDTGALIDGDRFIFPADIVFEPASARLKPQARRRALEIGRSLAAAGAALPAELDWVIRIDGHTDRQAVGGRLFASNRALSAARALEVAEVLTEAGVPPERLAPAAFGEFRPLDPGDTPDAYRRNRRIELRLEEG